jgi:hypothetical protein
MQTSGATASFSFFLLVTAAAHCTRESINIGLDRPEYWNKEVPS